MKNLISKVGAGVSVLPVLLLPAAVFAQNPFQDAEANLLIIGREAEINTGTSLYDLIGSIINIVLSLLGIIFLGIVLYAGFLYLTAGGDSDKVDKAKDWLKNGIIGLVLIVAAFAISNFVVTQLAQLAA